VRSAAKAKAVSAFDGIGWHAQEGKLLNLYDELLKSVQPKTAAQGQ